MWFGRIVNFIVLLSHCGCSFVWGVLSTTKDATLQGLRASQAAETGNPAAGGRIPPKIIFGSLKVMHQMLIMHNLRDFCSGGFPIILRIGLGRMAVEVAAATGDATSIN